VPRSIMRPNGRVAGDESTACLPLNNMAATHSSQVLSIAETDLDPLPYQEAEEAARSEERRRRRRLLCYLVIPPAYVFIGAGDEAAGSLRSNGKRSDLQFALPESLLLPLFYLPPVRPVSSTGAPSRDILLPSSLNSNKGSAAEFCTTRSRFFLRYP
jgi:hypothetical protein